MKYTLELNSLVFNVYVNVMNILVDTLSMAFQKRIVRKHRTSDNI